MYLQRCCQPHHSRVDAYHSPLTCQHFPDISESKSRGVKTWLNFIYYLLFIWYCFVLFLQVRTRCHHDICPTLSHQEISYLSPNNFFPSLKNNLFASVPNRPKLKNLVKLIIRYLVPSLGE